MKTSDLLNKNSRGKQIVILDKVLKTSPFSLIRALNSSIKCLLFNIKITGSLTNLCDYCNQTNLSYSTYTRYAKLLTEWGVLTRTKIGTIGTYSLTDKGNKVIDNLLLKK